MESLTFSLLGQPKRRFAMVSLLDTMEHVTTRATLGSPGSSSICGAYHYELLVLASSSSADPDMPAPTPTGWETVKRPDPPAPAVEALTTFDLTYPSSPVSKEVVYLLWHVGVFAIKRFAVCS